MSAESSQTTASSRPAEPPGKDFRTTRWTQVRRAKADSPDGRNALADLCNAYYEPVAAFLRYELRDADAAREVAHDFFAHMLAGGTITNAEQGRGRFRSYLLGAVKHFLAHQREAQRRLKRGGGKQNLSLNDTEVGAVPDGRVLSPDAAFDQQWALTALSRALEALRNECAAEGRADFFEQVKPWLTGDSAHGDQVALAARCGMNAVALKTAVYRLKRRYRQLLKAEIAGTLEDPAQVEAEMQALFAALGN